MPLGKKPEGAELDAKPDPRAGRPRSPNYPSITVERALGVAEKVYLEEKRFTVPLATICARAGFEGTKSGSAIRAVSALKKYGVFDEKDGMFTMTEAAKTYVLTPNDQALRLRTRRDMAKKYEESSQVLQNFPNGIPDDETLKRHFLLERGFTTSGASEFLGIFKDNISFAKLCEPDHTVDMPAEQEHPQVQKPNPPPVVAGGVDVFSIGGATVELRSTVPLDQMTAKQLQRLIKFIKVHEDIATEDGREE